MSDARYLSAWACGPAAFERLVRERVMAEAVDDYEQTFEDFWREVVCDPDGSLNADAVKRELHDYRMVLASVPEVYEHVSGGKLSKANTDPIHVKAAHDEACDESYEEGKKDERERCAAIVRAKADEIDPDNCTVVGASMSLVCLRLVDAILAANEPAEGD